MTAKEQLCSLRRMSQEINTMQDYITMLRQEAEGVGTMRLSDMPKGGISKDMSDAIAKIIDLQNDSYGLILSRLEKRELAMLVIAQIEKTELRTVLIRRYILNEKWEDIAAAMGYEISQVYRLHSEALQAYEEISNTVVKEREM